MQDKLICQWLKWYAIIMITKPGFGPYSRMVWNTWIGQKLTKFPSIYMPRGNVLAWIKIENNFSKSRLKLNFALFFSLTVILKSNKCSKLYKTDHLHLVPKIIFLAIIRNLPSFKLRKNKQKPEDYFLFFHICSHISLEYIHNGLLFLRKKMLKLLTPKSLWCLS